ncbi:MAG: ABC transporter permease, partial [Deltaproteobacteria bacterium]|nr:ABC transporter permease [Deltaproteobacteria bacterium]
MSFLIPLGLWCATSYLPFVWHPMIRVQEAGDASWFSAGELVDGDAFVEENERIRGEHGHEAAGVAANPVFLPAPHTVMQALVTGFTTPPVRPEEPWLHQALWHSIKIIFWGFAVSSL